MGVEIDQPIGTIFTGLSQGVRTLSHYFLSRTRDIEHDVIKADRVIRNA